MPDLLASLFTVENASALVALTALEIVLGIDNIVFIAIVTGRLPEDARPRARQTGLLAAMGMRILLLLGIQAVMSLQTTLFTLAGRHFTGKDLILLVGGLFLLTKATYEIHHRLERHGGSGPGGTTRAAATFGGAITQIMAIDLIFSLDSVITAVGMARSTVVMVAAVVAAVLVMMVFAGAVSGFVERYPTMKMLALAFLVLIAVLLVAEAFHQHIDRGYVYFAMGFALTVELLNIRAGRARGGVAATSP